jgi:hypothetical protein
MKLARVNSQQCVTPPYAYLFEEMIRKQKGHSDFQQNYCMSMAPPENVRFEVLIAVTLKITVFL